MDRSHAALTFLTAPPASLALSEMLRERKADERKLMFTRHTLWCNQHYQSKHERLQGFECPHINAPHLVPPDRSVVSCSEMLSCLLRALLSCKREIKVCVCVGKIVCPLLGSAPTDNKAEMSTDTEPQSDGSHLARVSSIILYFRFSQCLDTLRANGCTERWSFLWGLIMDAYLSLYLSLCVFCPPQFHNLQELRHSASLANKVFIQRDYSEGTTCKFQTKFPSELESRVRRWWHPTTRAFKWVIWRE